MRSENWTVRVEPGQKRAAQEACQYLGVSMASVFDTAMRSVIAKAANQRKNDDAQYQLDAIRRRAIEEEFRLVPTEPTKRKPTLRKSKT